MAENQAQRTVPRVNDQYWFDWSKSLVDSTITRNDQAAEKLQTLAGWLWGIYTASTAVGFGLAGKSLSLLSTVLIAAASLSIVAVYWASVWAQYPKLVRFDPRDPDAIQTSYRALLKSKRFRLNLALLLSSAAAALVVVALVTASITSERPAVSISESVAIISTVDDEPILSVTASISDAEHVVVSVITSEAGEKPILEIPYALDSSGHLQVEIPIESDASGIVVMLEWMTSDGTTVRVSREAKIAGQEDPE